ncbi:hypothetical protein NC653_031529 [Populus alba x Populus x berolinensis]|uniref:Uncharacterized protein n=1 Tax=Populus alba x Populus x berolinensis TaxID=444605 RepID=A0AAD6Q1N5_9ROSI|nr:hypothetical protein NC653_031529 [Populus alba x Populus x berolinensis]
MALDAHHCPGVMFLFCGEFGCLMYTRDFRWEVDSEREKDARSRPLNVLKNETVDVPYSDNTYCNLSYDFPTREVVDIIASHPEHDIVIGIDTLGKEELLIHISRVLNIKVRPERLQTMHILGFHDTFTTKTSLTRVQAVPHNSFSIETLEGLDTMRPTIGIMPSGLPWVPKPVKGDVNLFGSLLTSCYKKRQSSDKLDGIVSSSSCYVDPFYYFSRLCGGNQPPKRFVYKNERKEEGKKEVVVSYFESGNSPEAGRKKNRPIRVDYKRDNPRKTSASRRVSRGAKIMEKILAIEHISVEFWYGYNMVPRVAGNDNLPYYQYLKFYRAVVDELHHELSNTRSPYLNLI